MCYGSLDHEEPQLDLIQVNMHILEIRDLTPDTETGQDFEVVSLGCKMNMFYKSEEVCTNTHG